MCTTPGRGSFKTMLGGGDTTYHISQRISVMLTMMTTAPKK